MQILSTDILQSSGNIRLDVDATTLVVLATFVVLHQLLKALVFKPYLEDVDARNVLTVQAMERCSELKAKADELEGRYEELSSAARAEAQELRRALRVEGLDDKETRVGQARKDADASFAEQSSAIHEQFESAREDALSQVEGLAREIKTKVLGA